ncbi:hypothetical protein [Methanosarcina horonobensis]|uniref:hypothetical protein n=1 Tax=Methanosarcina horonobensis TaxID=418008 RepID=UPI000A9902E4|nr:hypothetical protein [Methanosarcina horonobensis]
MKKLGAVQYLAYVTFILIIFSILSGEAFATSSLSKNENGNQYADESIVDTENYEKDSSEDTNNVTENYSYKNLQGEDRTRIQDKDKFSAYKSEKKQIQEALQLQKSKYREIKEDFLKIRNQIQAGKLNPNSEKKL